MIRLEATLDYERIRTVMTNPKIYPHLADDFHPSPEQFWPNEHPSVTYLLAFDGEELLGLFITHPINNLLWEGHVVMLRHAWGRRARAAGKAYFAWLWQNTGAARALGLIPTSNPIAIRYAQSLGMRQVGRLERCYQRGGRKYDLIILSRTRPAKDN